MNKKFCDKKKHTFLTITWYGWAMAFINIILHVGLYKIAYAINKHCPVWSGFCPCIDNLDSNIPFVPWFFIQIYFLAYLFWFICPLIIAKRSRKETINFFIGTCAIAVLGFLMFILLPTWQDRRADGLQEKIDQLKDPFTKFLMNLIYKSDGGNKTFNMSPSFHCMFSIYAFLAIHRTKEAKLYDKIWIGIMTLLICLSTMFVKQHYFVDFFVAFILCCVVYPDVHFVIKPGEKILAKSPNFLILDLVEDDKNDQKNK